MRRALASSTAHVKADQAAIDDANRRADEAASAKAAAEKHVAELTAQLDVANRQLGGYRQQLAQLKLQLADAQQAKSTADEQARKAQADRQAFNERPSPGGRLRTIGGAGRDGAADAGGAVPDEIRAAFESALAWRANQIRSLEIQMRDTPSKADERALHVRLEKLRASPVAPAPLVPSELTLGQIGALEINGYLRVDEIVGENTIIVTPIQLAGQLTPQSAASGDAAAGNASAPNNAAGAAQAGSDYVREEDDPIEIHGLSTKGVAKGAKLAALPGVYYVEKTERYGARTMFVLAPVDVAKLRTYFDRLREEMRAAAMPKAHAGGDAVAK